MELAHYTTNFDDEVLSMDWKKSELENNDLQNYKAKAEFYVRQHQDEVVIAKLKGNVPLTQGDVGALERILWSEVGSREDYERPVRSSGTTLHRPGQRGGGVHRPVPVAGNQSGDRQDQLQCRSVNVTI